MTVLVEARFCAAPPTLKFSVAIPRLHGVEHLVGTIDRALQRAGGRERGFARALRQRRGFGLRHCFLHPIERRFAGEDQVDDRERGEEREVFHPCEGSTP